MSILWARKYNTVLLHIMHSFKVKYSSEATINTFLSGSCSFDWNKQKWGKPDHSQTILFWIGFQTTGMPCPSVFNLREAFISDKEMIIKHTKCQCLFKYVACCGKSRSRTMLMMCRKEKPERSVSIFCSFFYFPLQIENCTTTAPYAQFAWIHLKLIMT